MEYNVFGSQIDLQQFYPEKLKIKKITADNESGIVLKMYTESQECCCPKCKAKSLHRHDSYERKVQDLPILGHATWLYVNAYEYECDNPDCDVKTFVEDLDGFINYYGRATDRLTDFLCTLALETSCEASAKIMKSVGVKISGDTIIRMLMKKYGGQTEIKCGDTIGVDDFAFKKGREYGTVIVDEKTHRPVAILDGRDAATLSEWLKNNKHVKTVTRDRASAYSKAISEILPDCMQVADRFHLHQNLLDAIKNILGREIPTSTEILERPEDINVETASPKGAENNSASPIAGSPGEIPGTGESDNESILHHGNEDEDKHLSTSEPQDCKKNASECG